MGQGREAALVDAALRQPCHRPDDPDARQRADAMHPARRGEQHHERGRPSRPDRRAPRRDRRAGGDGVLLLPAQGLESGRCDPAAHPGRGVCGGRRPTLAGASGSIWPSRQDADLDGAEAPGGGQPLALRSGGIPRATCGGHDAASAQTRRGCGVFAVVLR